MRRILHRGLTSGPVDLVRRAIRLAIRNHMQLLAMAIVISLLLASLPATAGTKKILQSRTYAQEEISLPSELYRGVSKTVVSIGGWMASFVSSESPRNSAYQPVAAYISPAPPFIDAPTNLTVTTVASNNISLTWTAPGGTVDHYVLERSENIGGPFLFVANVTGTTTKNDTSVTNLHAYLYRVRAVSSTGAISVPSNMALGTAISFEFQTLSGHLIKAQHFQDVRTAINLLRQAGNQPNYSWARSNLTGLGVLAADVTEMRTALDAGLTALNIPVTAYQDTTLNTGTLIKAIHLEELQSRSTLGSSNSFGPLDTDSSTARLDPMNETGGGGENPLSRNFNWNLPLVSLPGRAGLDLGLTLSYNSLVWTKISNTAISFDDDNGFPGPGFRLGFPVIQQPYFNTQTSKNSYLLIHSDGSHVELRQVGSSAYYEAGDSSHLSLNSNTMILSTTDGTQLSYVLEGSEYKCTQIKDRNGNYITIAYTPSGQLSTITDTLGRVIIFNYDTGWLTEIKQVWNQQLQNPPTHYWAKFEYTNTPLDFDFGNLSVYGATDNSSIKTLSKVTLADNSHFDFSYTSWGQVFQITEFAADNSPLNYRFYDLPQTGAPAHSDCPRFMARKDWAKYWNGDTNGTMASSEEVATSTFIVPESATWTMPEDAQAVDGMRAQVTSADGAVNKIYFIGVAGQSSGWRRGLPALVDTFAGGGPDPVRRVSNTWIQDSTSSTFPQDPRVAETNVRDLEGNHSRTEIAYEQVDLGNGVFCYLPHDVKEYDPNAPSQTVLRTTRTLYNTSQTYKDRHILGLVSEKQLYDGNVNSGGTLMADVVFNYDESGSIVATDPALVQHDNSINYNESLVIGRGNLSSVKRYNVTALTEFTVTTSKYNTAGAVISSKDALNHEVQISYTDSFSDNNNSRHTLAYPTTITDPDNYSSTAQYNFDFGAVTYKRTPPSNVTDTTNTSGPEQTFIYDSIGRLQQINNLVNNAYTRFEYGISGQGYSTAQIRVDTYTTIQEGLGEAHSFTITDGAGRVIATAKDHNTNTLSGERRVYDVMGRLFKTSNPTETSASGTPFQWATVGDDESAGWIYMQQTYDWKGRPLVTTNQDGTTKTASYSGCGCAGGEVVSLTDEGTIVGGVERRRQQKIYSDVLGRTVKTEVLNWGGESVYSTTVNTYNARDQITNTKQYAGPEATGNAYQETTASYDGYGRLQFKHIPQESPGTGTTWSYNPDDTISTVTDARGALSTFGYVGTNRGLVKTITHTLSGKPTINISFNYDAASNRILMIDPMGTSNYTYDQLSQLTTETRTLAGTTYVLSYQYNLGGQLKKMTYPGNMSINYGYDRMGRLNAVTGSDTLYQGVSQYASGFTYRASGAQKTITDGANRTGTMTYDRRLRPVTYQISGGTVNQSYEYYNDGSMRFVHNDSDSNFDRFFEYDQNARLTYATTGGSARGDLGAVPYYETFGYNAWGDTTSRFTETWSRDEFVDVGTFTNGKRDGWGYEADGKIKTIDTRSYSYDAAGNLVLMSGQLWTGSSYVPTSTASAYDGNGERVEEVLSYPSTFTTRYLRSSVLGGAVVQEINSAGQTISYVYLPDGTQLSTLIGFPKWRHETPGGTGLYETFQSGFVNRVEFDPVKANVALTTPPPPDTHGGAGDIGGDHNGGPTDSRFSDLANPAAGCYEVGGVVLPCGTWSSLDVYEFFVWGPARQAAVSMPSGLSGALGSRQATALRDPGSFYELGNIIGRITRPAPAPFVNIRVLPRQPQNTVDSNALKKAFGDCINELYSMFEMTSFKPTTKPHGTGGTRNDDMYNGVTGLRDLQTGTEFNIVNDPTPPPSFYRQIGSNDVRGGTPLNNPWWTYTVSSGATLSEMRPAEKRYPDLYLPPGMDYVRTQIHETGAALSLIRDRYHPGPWAPLSDNGLYPRGHGDEGPAMEDCVGRHYYASQGLKPAR